MSNRAVLLDVEETLWSNGRLYPDTMDFLEACMDNEIKLVAFTDGASKSAEDSLNIHKIRDYFTLVFSCPEYAMKKPDPRAVNVIRTLLRDEHGFKVSKENMIVVGDRPDTDICCGNRAKVQTIRVKRGNYSHKQPEYEDEQPQKEVETLKDAAQVLGLSITKKSTSKKSKSKSQTSEDAGTDEQTETNKPKEQKPKKIHETDASVLFG